MRSDPGAQSKLALAVERIWKIHSIGIFPSPLRVRSGCAPADSFLCQKRADRAGGHLRIDPNLLSPRPNNEMSLHLKALP
jgi:hypothetical protein